MNLQEALRGPFALSVGADCAAIATAKRYRECLSMVEVAILTDRLLKLDCRTPDTPWEITFGSLRDLGDPGTNHSPSNRRDQPGSMYPEWAISRAISSHWCCERYSRSRGRKPPASWRGVSERAKQSQWPVTATRRVRVVGMATCRQRWCWTRVVHMCIIRQSKLDCIRVVLRCCGV